MIKIVLKPECGSEVISAGRRRELVDELIDNLRMNYKHCYYESTDGIKEDLDDIIAKVKELESAEFTSTFNTDDKIETIELIKKYGEERDFYEEMEINAMLHSVHLVEILQAVQNIRETADFDSALEYRRFCKQIVGDYPSEADYLSEDIVREEPATSNDWADIIRLKLWKLIGEYGVSDLFI